MSLRNVRYQYLVAVAFVFGTFMDILDTTIINVAIPQLRAHFGVGRTTIEWVITGYLCSLAVLFVSVCFQFLREFRVHGGLHGVIP